MYKICKMFNVTIVEIALSTKNITITCISAVVGAGVWFYNKTITDPLRTFYFTGPWYWNSPISEICYEMTKVEAKYWESTPDTMEQCKALTERKFDSFYATVWTTFYFTLLTFIIMQLTCHFCLIRPIIKCLKR